MKRTARDLGQKLRDRAEGMGRVEPARAFLDVDAGRELHLPGQRALPVRRGRPGPPRRRERDWARSRTRACCPSSSRTSWRRSRPGSSPRPKTRAWWTSTSRTTRSALHHVDPLDNVIVREWGPAGELAGGDGVPRPPGQGRLHPEGGGHPAPEAEARLAARPQRGHPEQPRLPRDPRPLQPLPQARALLRRRRQPEGHHRPHRLHDRRRRDRRARPARPGLRGPLHRLLARALLLRDRARAGPGAGATSSGRSPSPPPPTCGAVSLLVFYFDAARLEKPLEPEEVRRIVETPPHHLGRPRGRGPGGASSAEREGRQLFRRYVRQSFAAASTARPPRPARCAEDIQYFERAGRPARGARHPAHDGVGDPQALLGARSSGSPRPCAPCRTSASPSPRSCACPSTLPEGRRGFLYRFEHRVHHRPHRVAAPGERERFAKALRALDEERATDDPLNGLILLARPRAGSDVEVLRTVRNHLLQIRPHYNVETVNGVLLRNSPAAVALFRYFAARFDPRIPGDRAEAIEGGGGRASRRPCEAVREPGRRRGPARASTTSCESALRTNFYQRPERARPRHQGGQPQGRGHALAAADVRDLRALAHARGHPPARGQGGARGHPLERPPRRLPHRSPGPHEDPDGQERDHRARGLQGRLRAEGRRALAPRPRRLPRSTATASSSPASSTSPTTSWTAQVLHPPEVVRHDGDDPYLVVAADKGTAHLSRHRQQRLRASTASGWATPSPPAAAWATTTRRSASPRAGPGSA